MKGVKTKLVHMHGCMQKFCKGGDKGGVFKRGA